MLYAFCAAAQEPAYKNTVLSVDVRVKDLLQRMTLEEKTSQLGNTSPAIERLGIPAYNWWNEALHGVARAGLATSFPQPIGIAATFNKDAVFAMGTIVSDEARAKYDRFVAEGKRDTYEGLSFFSPNINIFRDPRWGRGHETYGEDPYLTGTMATAFVNAMQGNDPDYFKTICTAKHFAVHSGPEPLRHEFNAVPSKKDLWETYLPAFKMLAQDAHVYSVMCAYNRLYNEPCCSNPFLLNDVLRKKWGFKGFVVTDCGAVYDMFMFHNTAADSVEATAKTIKAGVDNFCYGYPDAALEAVHKGLLTEADIDTAVSRLLTARIKLGMFDDDPSKNPYNNIPYSVVNSQKHIQAALEMAEQSVVLLKNNNHTLPLVDARIKTIAVIGPNADDTEVPLGNYEGTPAHVVSLLEGIKSAMGEKIKLIYTKGCDLTDTSGYIRDKDFAPALYAASQADIIIFAGGISPRLEGEEMPIKIDGFAGGDKTNLELPAVQTALLKELKKAGKPIVLVLMNGSALSINWENENMDAIVEAWYDGEQAGNAIASVLFGKYNPAGRLPLTFYKSIDDIPPFSDYSMKGKTYRFCEKPVLYPFGYGLSYTNFEYSRLKISSKNISGTTTVSFTIKNTGKADGDEVPQLYIHEEGQLAIKELKAYTRVFVPKGTSKRVSFQITPSDIQHYSEEKDDLDIIPGKIKIMIGASSQDIRLSADAVLINAPGIK